MFDIIASEYGYTYEEFKQMTLRTLHGALEMINIRTHNEYVKQAALKGIKLEAKKIRRKITEMSTESKEKTLHLHAEAIKRKVAEKRAKRK